MPSNRLLYTEDPPSPSLYHSRTLISAHGHMHATGIPGPPSHVAKAVFPSFPISQEHSMAKMSNSECDTCQILAAYAITFYTSGFSFRSYRLPSYPPLHAKNLPSPPPPPSPKSSISRSTHRRVHTTEVAGSQSHVAKAGFPTHFNLHWSAQWLRLQLPNATPVRYSLHMPSHSTMNGLPH